MRRVPVSHSSTSALLLSPLMYLGSAPGYSATICQSSSAMRCILKVTRGLLMPANMRALAGLASPSETGVDGPCPDVAYRDALGRLLGCPISVMERHFTSRFWVGEWLSSSRRALKERLF